MEYENLILQQLEQLDLSSLYQIAGMVQEHAQVSVLSGLRELIAELFSGEISFSGQVFLHQGLLLFFRQVQQSLSTCSRVLAVCVLAGLLNNVASSFGKEAVSRVGNTICLLIVATACAGDFIETYRYCRESMELMIVAVQSLFPIMLPLLLASGKTVAGAVLNPAILGVIAMISSVMDRYILPAVFLSCSLCIAGRMTEQGFLNRAGGLLKDITVFAVGLTVTVLSAFTAVQGTMGKTADSLLLKTARFSVDNFIPLIGGFAADSMDMVLSCTTTIKNAVGLWGVLLLVVALLFPLLKMAAIVFVYRAGAVLADALSGKLISSCLEDIASAVTTLAVIYTLMGILFIVFVSTLTALV